MVQISADNFIGVYQNTEREKWIVVDGSMSCETEDCQYRGREFCSCDTREKALVEAHNQAAQEVILEYGVFELDPVPSKFCGHCWVCVNERKVVANDIEKCDRCGDPMTSGEWRISNHEGKFHRSCYRSLEQELDAASSS